MKKVITINELKTFLKHNNSKLDDNSAILIVKDNTFGFLKHVSFLNLDGVYDWKLDNGELIEGTYGDALSMWCLPNIGKITYNEISENKCSFDDLFYNFSFDTKPPNLKEFKEEIDNIPNNNAIVTALMGRDENPFGVIYNIKIKKNIKLKYHDSWGHDVESSPISPSLILEIGMGFKQIYNPDKTNESYIIKKYNDFIK